MWGLLIALLGTVTFFPKKAQAAFGPFVPYGPPAPDRSRDIDVLARTIWGEARGEGAKGMQAVANVIMNRFRLATGSLSYARQFGATVADICTKKYQFSVWLRDDPNYLLIQRVTTADALFAKAMSIASSAVGGRLSDITGGADHYHTASVLPSWARGETPVRVIGSHEFYKLAA